MTTNSKVGLTLRDVLTRDFWPAIRRENDACRLCGAEYQPEEAGQLYCSEECLSADKKIDEAEAAPQASAAHHLKEV
jgi:hypothetical protein